MVATCPQGHQSSTDDFCDVCGTPIEPPATPAPAAPAPASGASVSAPAGPAPAVSAPAVSGQAVSGQAGASAVPAPSATAPAPKVCPNCGSQNATDALFCEDCGYDFATGQLPPPSAAIDPASGVLAPAAAAASTPTLTPNLAGVDWVAEVWVDPDWFAFQQAEGACPTGGVPAVVALTGTTALIGRRSRSRSLSPEIDCTSDGAISHSHAELIQTGGRWSVKDLGSTNGTYVGRPDGTYPADPLPARQARELADDERVYVGAWTRIVVRKATAAEKAGRAP